MLRMPDADAYDYDLPRELIAQEPLADRSAARMLVVRRSDGALAHRHVHDLVDLLHPGDLLVVNDTRVVPARLEGRREMTGGRWEGLWLESLADGDWRLLAHTRGRMAIGERVVCLAAADDWLNEHESDESAHKTKRWLREAPTDKQLIHLPPAARADLGMTRYQASALLTFQFNRNAIRGLVMSADPASMARAA